MTPDTEECPTCGCKFPSGDLCPNAPHDEAASKADMVDHPPHYNASGIEVIAAIDAWELGFCLGNAVKYIARAEHKGKPLEDLEKALWYLNHEIEKRKKEEK